MQTVTVTFDLATRFLFATHRLVMVIICAKVVLNPTRHNKVMDRTRTGFTEVYAQSLVQTVTLTVNLATGFLFATHCLVMMIIFAKLFLNPTLHKTLMCRTQTGFTEAYAQSLSADCDLDL